jgi:hypothetical protein
MWRQKLGLDVWTPAAARLFADLEQRLHDDRIDWTIFWRQLVYQIDMFSPPPPPTRIICNSFKKQSILIPPPLFLSTTTRPASPYRLTWLPMRRRPRKPPVARATSRGRLKVTWRPCSMNCCPPGTKTIIVDSSSPPSPNVFVSPPPAVWNQGFRASIYFF